MDQVSLSTFPDNRATALTMLYLENKDLSNATPEELVSLYQDTHSRIRKAFRSNQETS